MARRRRPQPPAAPPAPAPEPAPPSCRSLGAAAAATFLVALLAYLRTLAPTVVGGDSGELICAARVLGVAHPPGYPLYTLLGHLATLLPLGSMAVRVNLLSALADAGAAGLLCLAVHRVTGRAGAGVLAGLAFALSPMVWPYAVTAEVFALNNLLVAALLALSVRGLAAPERTLPAAALVFGLGLSNHHTILFLGGPLLLGLAWQARAHLDRRLLLLSAGYQFREQQGENDTDLINRVLSSHAGFAQAQFNLWDRVFATAGVRHDSYNVFGNATTYRLTGGYYQKETDTKLRVGYSTGFRAPSMNELYFPNFGNPNLGPEKNQSMDAGIDQYFFSKQLKLSGGFFWNHYRNLIVTTFDPGFCAPFSTFGFCPQQLGEASTKGWEAGLTYTYSSDRPFLKGVVVQAQYTNTITRDLDTQTRLPRWPTDQWSASVSYQPIDPLWITVIGRYVGSRFNTTGDRQAMPAFDVWSLAVTYDVTKQMQAYLRAENLFNEKYEEIASAGTPIRSIFGGLRVTFGGKS